MIKLKINKITRQVFSIMIALVVFLNISVPLTSAKGIEQSGEVSITDEMPRSGGIIIGEDGKIISVSDKSLEQVSSNESEYTTYARDTVYFSYGRWNWATTINWDLSKTALSNFIHYDLYHTATAIVGGVKDKVGAVANEHAIAQKTGKGVAEVYYDF